MSSLVRYILACWGPFFCLPVSALMAQLSTQQETGTTSKHYNETEIAYSQACLDLARFELQNAGAIKNSLSVGALERRRIAVKLAEERLRVATTQEADTDTLKVRLRFAEESAKKAKHDYLRALASKNFTASQIEHLRLKSEVAKRKLEVMQNPAHFMSILDHMHWEIERLNDAVTALELTVQQVER